MSTDEKVDLGIVIYSCVKPIFKIYLILGTGFLLAKVDILNAESIRMISQIVLTVLLPALSFNKIVSNIEDKYIKDVGIVCLTSVLLYATGFLCGYLVKLFMPVPKKWHGGLICSSMFPNISDLPIAYLQTMDNNIIFTQEETEVGTAMVIIFLATFMLAVFNLGGFQLIEMDFRKDKLVKTIDEENNINGAGDNTIELKTIANSDDNNNNNNNIISQENSLNKNDDDSNTNSDNQSQNTSAFELESNVSSTNSDVNSLHSNDQSRTNLSKVVQPQKYINANNKSKASTLDSARSNIQIPDSSVNDNPTTTGIQRRRSISHSILSNSTNGNLTLRKPTNLGNNNNLVREFSKVDTMGNAIPEDSLARYLSLQALQNEQNMTPEEQRQLEHAMDVASSAATMQSFHTTRSINSTIPDNSSMLTKVRSSKLAKMVTQEANVRRSDIEDSGKNLRKQFQFMKYVIFFAQNCLRPCSLSVIIALVIAFIPWVRGIFVQTSNAHIPNAPDGQPPLSFIMDFTSYIGAASVPFGLLLLGATLGNLQIKSLYPGFWKSAVAMCILKQVVMPIIGVLWCERMMDAGWLDRTRDKMLLFVIAIDWALPTMTTMIYLTASYTPIDSTDTTQMDCVSFFLLLQYPFLVISLPFLATYYIKVQLKM